MFSRGLIVVLLGLILGVPFVMSIANREAAPPADARTLLIVTPHVPQIRREFAAAFERWHQKEFGQAVRVDMRAPGGTSEILTQLQAQFTSAIKQGSFTIADDGRIELPKGTAAYDLMFGGGSYDHGRLKSGVRVTQPLLERTGMTRALGLDGLSESQLPQGELDAAAVFRLVTAQVPAGVRIYRDADGNPMIDVTVAMSAPAGFDEQTLNDWFGENKIGTQNLYDPEQYWLGTALSSFGIVYNRDLCDALGIGVPDSFQTLTDPRLIDEVALADPRQSGSITTTFDSILGNYGWDEGWRILRAMSGNTRYFTNSSTKPPMDVSQGEAAVGLAIDFYGRGQAQAVGGDRVGYAEPRGAVYVDADPISLMNGAADPELARRFIRFVLSEQGQALWQLPPTNSAAGKNNPRTAEGELMGPERNALRRMPVERSMYDRYRDSFIDKADPFSLASDTMNPGWRAGVEMMMGAFGIDAGQECRGAWKALATARQKPGFPENTLAEMEELFYAFPPQEMPDGSILPFTQQNYGPIHDLWHDPIAARKAKIDYVRFFRSNFAKIVDLAHTPASG